MKSKLPAIILALGLSAVPVSAKQQNRRSIQKLSPGIEQKKNEKRSENTFKRLCLLEAEKDFIKETEDEIQNILDTSIIEESSENVIERNLTSGERVVLKDDLPVNGIDISEHYLKIIQK